MTADRAQCPTCGAETPEQCRFRADPVGCDHPVLLRDMAEGFAALMDGSLVASNDDVFNRWMIAHGYR